jgi:hypothetical protein
MIRSLTIKLITTACLVILCNFVGRSQSGVFDLSFEFQAYPTGLFLATFPTQAKQKR